MRAQRKFKKAWCSASLGLGGWLALTAGATPSLQECFEGSDFIVNAALSRNAGLPAAAFLERMEGDFVLVRAFPSELRWFVHDEADEALLLAAAHRVYSQPLPPEMHRRQFLDACVERVAMIVPGGGDGVAPATR